MTRTAPPRRMSIEERYQNDASTRSSRGSMGGTRRATSAGDADMIGELVAAATALGLGVLWLAERVVKRAFEREDKLDDAETPLMPWHSTSANCALCGQSSYFMRPKAKGGSVEWSCDVCKGVYRTNTRTASIGVQGPPRGRPCRGPHR